MLMSWRDPSYLLTAVRNDLERSDNVWLLRNLKPRLISTSEEFRQFQAMLRGKKLREASQTKHATISIQTQHVERDVFEIPQPTV